MNIVHYNITYTQHWGRKSKHNIKEIDEFIIFKSIIGTTYYTLYLFIPKIIDKYKT